MAHIGALCPVLACSTDERVGPASEVKAQASATVTATPLTSQMRSALKVFRGCTGCVQYEAPCRRHRKQYNPHGHIGMSEVLGERGSTSAAFRAGLRSAQQMSTSDALVTPLANSPPRDKGQLY